MALSLTHEANRWNFFAEATILKNTFVNQSKKVGNVIKNTANAVEDKWKETSTVTKTCIIGGASAAAAPFVILPLLGAVGFTSAGVAAGSIAASMQTATTVSGSVFALCQSAAATGAVATSTSMGVSLAAGATASGVTAAVCKKKSPGKKNDNEEKADIEEPKNVEEDTVISVVLLKNKCNANFILKLSQL